MIDQSHNITDPVESLLSSAEAICGFSGERMASRQSVDSQADEPGGRYRLILNDLSSDWSRPLRPDTGLPDQVTKEIILLRRS